YRRDVAGKVARERLDAGSRSALSLLDHLTVVVVDVPGAARTARDVDVPADLDHARRTTTSLVTVVGADGRAQAREVDHLVGEEPLRILVAGPGQTPIAVTTTMRTPGHELELAVGLLHAEGLLRP